MRLSPLATVSSLTLLATTLACDPLFNPLFDQMVPEEQGLECGEAPASFDPQGNVVQGAATEGCVRIERSIERSIGADGVRAPQRLVIHAEGFSRRYDIDTTELTYEASDGNMADVITTTTDDDVAVRIQVDICTGEWTLSVDDGEVSLPVVGQ